MALEKYHQHYYHMWHNSIKIVHMNMIFDQGRNKGNSTLVVIMKFWECDSRLGLFGLGCRLCYLSWAWKYDHCVDG